MDREDTGKSKTSSRNNKPFSKSRKVKFNGSIQSSQLRITKKVQGKSIFFYFDPKIIVTRIPFPQYAEQWYKQEYPGPSQGV